MGTKKKGKKRSSGASGRSLSGGLKSLSLSPSSATLSDVSPLLFNGSNGSKLPFDLPFIGPISLAERGLNIAEKNASVVHGRGLIAARDISIGECLFVVSSIVSADAAVVRKRYLQEDDGRGDATVLERIAEDHLVEQVQSLCEILDDEEIWPKDHLDRVRRLLGAFSAQMSSDEVPTIEKTDEWLDIFVANKSSSTINLDSETILSTIRRNAFGPDFHNYGAIAQCWSTTNTENSYNRILGVYPLSAAINHSCSPNAVRVFGRMPSPNGKTSSSDIDAIQGREVMIVHANANIPKGTEITWSYLPPSTPFAARREMLQSNYGFTCRCMRCIKEEVALDLAECKELWTLSDAYWSLRDAKHHEQGEATMMHLVPSLESAFASTEQLSNELQRYLRVGYASLYMDFFNASLSLGNDEKMTQILKLATQLHFSFVSCNNASTEHLSILHLCLDLSNMLYAHTAKGSNPDAASAMSQVRFWTEQLKKAHMVRYGELGEDLNVVREAMKHSKLVLRKREGWYLSKDRFI
ncbi:hypothetical protein ACHAXR_003000 [Thalassiosira sp. AJA248-18]